VCGYLAGRGFDVNVIVHCPLAFVFAPALVQLPVGAL
jgi:hypothetical protein